MKNEDALRAADLVLTEAIQEQIRRDDETPYRIFLPLIARSNFEYVAGTTAAMRKVVAAYSVKTNPRPEMLGFARDCGLLAEVISTSEYELARSCGFGSERIIYNGPRPLASGKVLVAFADSPESLERYCHEHRSSVGAIRYRPSHVNSRFGILEDDLQECAQIIRESAAATAGLQFHVRPEDYGDRSWASIAEEALAAAVQLENLSGKAVSHLDVGGGWTPEALQHAIVWDLPRLSSAADRELEHLEMLLIEPGQGVATPVEAVVTRVLEVRNRRGFTEAIVDSGYPDLPQIRTFSHRIFHLIADSIVRLPFGRDRVSGSTCLEYDILREGVQVDGVLARGDLLVVADAGAYDASMSFAFAHGKKHAVA